MLREIIGHVDNAGNSRTIEAVSKTSKAFSKLVNESISEGLERNLKHYEKRGKYGTEARFAAIFTNKMKNMHQYLRVSLKAYREKRLLRTFLRWTNEKTNLVSFYHQAVDTKYFRNPGLPDRKLITMLSCCRGGVDDIDDHIKKMKKENKFDETMLMDRIVQYVYTVSVTDSARKWSIKN